MGTGKENLGTPGSSSYSGLPTWALVAIPVVCTSGLYGIYHYWTKNKDKAPASKTPTEDVKGIVRQAKPSSYKLPGFAIVAISIALLSTLLFIFYGGNDGDDSD